MRKYLVDFNTAEMKKSYTDVLIIGSGIAGVYTALELDDKYKITLITKEEVEISNSVLAQGGIAVSLDKNDSAKYTYAYSLYTNGKSNIESQECDQQSSQLIIANGKNNIKSQEYDPESSELIITYNKKSEESEETKSYINLRNMVVKFDDTITEPVINFDTNEITKPRIIIEN